LAAGDPLGEFKRSPAPLAAIWGLLLREGRGKRKGKKGETQPHFQATPLRGGIEGQGWEREEGRGERGRELGGGYCLQLLGGS